MPGGTGQLNTEGQAIKRMVLVRKGVENPYDPKSFIVLDRPGRSVSLPAGEYCLRTVEFDGGVFCIFQRGIRDRLTRTEGEGEWLTISPEKPHSLKFSGPLKPTVLATREGRSLRFVHRLFDANGREYVQRGPKHAPRFTVFCNGQVVGSGSFEYG
jgi:hypothetical protein